MTYEIQIDDLPQPIPGSADTGPGYQFIITGDAAEALQDFEDLMAGGTPGAGALLRLNNLDDLDDVPTARTNLGLGTAAEEDVAFFEQAGLSLLKAANLSDLADPVAARTALGLGSMALESTADWLSKSGNLAGLADAPTARANLGLGAVSVLATITEADMTLADNTTNDTSITKHGFAPKLPNDATKFLDGVGGWTAISANTVVLVDNTDNDVTTVKHGFTPKAPGDVTKWFRGDATWSRIDPVVVELNSVSGNVSLDWAGVEQYRLNLTGNIDITTMSNLVDGKRYVLQFRQDGTGGRTLTMSFSGKRFSVDTPSTDYVLSTGANLVDYFAFIPDNDASKIDFVAKNKGFS